MKHNLFSGACTALVTPFLNGEVNYPMLEQLLRRQIDAGIKAVVICGTTGEAPTLSDEEKIEMFKRCKSYAGNKCLIIAGTGSNSTEHTVKLSQKAENAGADALLVVSPYYNKATPEGMLVHYQKIAENVSVPVIIYNVPSRTGVDIPVSVYHKLSKIPNIVGVKEASSDITKITKIRSACGEDFSIWSGNDEHTVPAIALGAKGIISVLSNVCPEETQAMAQASLSGSIEIASAIQCQLQPLLELLFCEVNPIPVKAAMRCIGYDCGQCRLPLTEMDKNNYIKLSSYFS